MLNPCSLGLLVIGLCLLTPSAAQMPDVLISGDLIDAVSGDTLRNGHVTVVRLNGNGSSYQDPLSIYTGLDVELNGEQEYMLYFTAQGHTTRLAHFDLSAMPQRSNKAELTEVTMYIPLTPRGEEMPADTNFQRLGKCVAKKGAQLAWTSEDAAKAYPIKRHTQHVRLEHSRAMDGLGRNAPVAVVGAIKDHWTDQLITDAEVFVTGSDGTEETWRIGPKGVYRGVLQFDRVYRLVYRAPGRVSKIVVISTEDIPDGERLGGYGMDVDMRLFADIPGEDLSFLQEPLGRAHYMPDRKVIHYDMEYSTPRLQRLKEVLDKHKR